MATTVIDLLKQVELFHNTPEPVLNDLCSCVKKLDFAPGDRIITKGDEGDTLFIIGTGSVKVHDGDEVVATLRQGNFFGEISLLDSAPRSMSVTAVEQSQLCAIAAEDFYRVFGSEPEVAKIIISTLTRRLRRQNETTINQLRMRESQLSEMVQERTRELNEKNIALMEAKQHAEDAKRQEELFLANMSHEIRTPMNAVMGMTNLLLTTTNPHEQQLKYLKAIKTSSENLLIILNDILDLSKIQAGKIELENIVFSLPDLLENVHSTLRFKAEEKGIYLKTNIEGEGFDFLIGDPVRLNQVLINLAGNAIKFTEKGGVTINAKLLSKSADNKAMIEFRVIDTGIGIPANKLDKIFESFGQASEETTRKYGGTGLGLTISKQLVEIKGGTVRVTSEVGKGSNFIVTIPYPISTEKVVKEQSVSHDPAVIRKLAGLKILLTDDNTFNRIVAVDTLQSLVPGIAVDEAIHGKDAVEKLKAKDYDLILMDIQMPEMNGYEATQYIRANFAEPKRSIQIVAMTAGVTHAEREKATQSGMNHYITKPFKPEELLSKLAAIAAELKKPEVSGTEEAKPAFTVAKEVPSGGTKYTDMTFLNNFTGGNKEKRAKYIGMFLDECPNSLEQMKAHLKDGNYGSLRGVAHALKPQITYMGINSGVDLIKKIEQYAGEKINIESLPAMVDEFKGICDHAIPELRQIMQE